MAQIEIDLDLLQKAKSKKKVWVKPTATRKGHYREQEVGEKVMSDEEYESKCRRTINQRDEIFGSSKNIGGKGRVEIIYRHSLYSKEEKIKKLTDMINQHTKNLENFNELTEKLKVLYHKKSPSTEDVANRVSRAIVHSIDATSRMIDAIDYAKRGLKFVENDETHLKFSDIPFHGPSKMYRD